MPSRLRPFFFAEAREEYKKDYSATDEEVRKIDEQRLTEEYGSDIRKVRPLVMRALHEGQRFC